MGVTVASSELSCGHEQLEDELLLLDLTVVNSYAPVNSEKEAKRPEAVITASSIKRKQNKYTNTFPSTYNLLSLAVSTCGTLGSDKQALAKTMAITSICIQGDMPTGLERPAVDVCEMAHPSCRFSLVLQLAFSQSTGYHLC